MRKLLHRRITRLAFAASMILTAATAGATHKGPLRFAASAVAVEAADIAISGDATVRGRDGRIRTGP